MEESVGERINKSLWTVDNFIKEAKELLNKAQKLSLKERSELPKFIGVWKEDEIERHLERLKEAIDEPRIASSRKLLEKIGISTKAIPKDILEETEKIEDITSLFYDLKEKIGEVANVLIKREIIIKWLMEGLLEAKNKLESAVDTATGFKRLLNLENLSGKLKEKFLERAFEDSRSISDAEELNLQIGYIKEYGIVTEYRDEDLKEFSEQCKKTYQYLKKFENEYQLLINEVKEWIGSKDLREVCTVLADKETEVFREYAKLKKEWRELSDILGEESPEPKGIPNLRARIKELEERCNEILGENGQKLLNFLRGKTEFPDELSKEQLKEALKILRPFITISFRGEE